MQQGNAQVLQMQSGADPRQHEQLRRTKSTPRNNHFFARTHLMVHAVDLVFDAYSTFAFKHNLRGVRMRDDIQIALMAVRVNVCSGRVPTLAALLRDLTGRHPKLLSAVVIGVAWNALLVASLHEQLVQGAGAAQKTHIQRTAHTPVICCAKALVVF